MKTRKILIIFILIGLLSSIVLSFNRIKVESNNKKVDFVLDYYQLDKLAEQSSKDIKWWLEGFKKLGVSSVSIYEESLDSMTEYGKPLDIKIVEKIKEDIDWKDKYPVELVDYLEQKKVDNYDLVVRTKSKESYEFIKNGLSQRYSNEKYQTIESEDESYSIILDGTIKEALFKPKENLVDTKYDSYSYGKELISSTLLTQLGIDYDKEKIDVIKSAGLDIVLRPLNYIERWKGKKYVDTSLDQYEKFNIKPKYMIFTGQEVLGYPKYVDLVKDFIVDNDMKLALIESSVERGHAEQRGLEKLTEDLDYNVVRLYSIPDYIQQRYKYNSYKGGEEIGNTLYRAITERNIRAIYFSPFKLDSKRYVTDFSKYEEMFESLETRLGEHNITIGDASSMKPNHVNTILKMLIGIGILGGGVILLQEMFRIKKKFLNIIIILGLLAIVITSIVIPELSSLIFAMVAAIVFPSLSMIYFCKKLKVYYDSRNRNTSIKNTLLLGVKQLVIMILISAIASIFIAATLSDIEFLLEIDIFRGVKIVQLVPILVYVITFIGYFGYKREKSITDNKIKALDIKDILSDNIKIGYVALAGIVLYVGYIYLARTGHETGVKPSEFELMARNLLEVTLLARPRTKEFLIAFPAILVALDFAFNRRKLMLFVIGLLVALGQTSVANTFSHLRTPMYLSILRLTYGAIAGIIIGIIYVLIIRLVFKLIKYVGGKVLNE